LKCRIHHEKSSKKEFCEHFKGYPLQGFYWPQQVSYTARTQAFMKFASDKDRRTAHQLNETYVGGWQVRLLACTSHAMQDEIAESRITFEDVDLELLAAPADQRRKNDPAEQIRIGLRKAESIGEVTVLVQRAKALGLRNEAEAGEAQLNSMLGKVGGGELYVKSSVTRGVDHHPAAAEVDDSQWSGGKGGAERRRRSDSGGGGYQDYSVNVNVLAADAAQSVDATASSKAGSAKVDGGRARATTAPTTMSSWQ